jgi:hypothetical protein
VTAIATGPIHDDPADWTAAWTQALDALELDVAETERLLIGSGPSSAQTQAARWVAPTDLGPIPQSLQARAIAVHARQIETGRRLALALGATRRESDLAHRLSQFGPHHSPLYVDHLM